jgi:hypothetical protein
MGGSTGLHGNYIEGLEGSYLKVSWGSIDISLEALLDVEPVPRTRFQMMIYLVIVLQNLH